MELSRSPFIATSVLCFMLAAAAAAAAAAKSYMTIWVPSFWKDFALSPMKVQNSCM